MSTPSRLQIGILVTAATLIVCSLGVRAELKSAQDSIGEHRLQTQRAQPATPSIAATHDGQALNPPAALVR
jgi:hypothetical protein